MLKRRLWLGSTELRTGTVRSVVDRFVHPEYRDDSTGEFDMMVMKVNASLLLESDGVTPNGLEAVTLNSDALVPADSQELFVIGHGRRNDLAYELEEDLQTVIEINCWPTTLALRALAIPLLIPYYCFHRSHYLPTMMMSALRSTIKQQI